MFRTHGEGAMKSSFEVFGLPTGIITEGESIAERVVEACPAGMRGV